MQKMARKKKNQNKCGDNNLAKDQVLLENAVPESKCNEDIEKGGEWNMDGSDKKQSSPGYIPNNPHYFPDIEQGKQFEIPCSAKSSYQGYIHPTCPPPPFNIPPAESIVIPCGGKYPDECGARPEIYAESYYPKNNRSEMYDYGPWNRYSDYPCESPISSAWSSCVAGCQGDCCMIHSNDEHSNCSQLSTSQQVEAKHSYYHCNSSIPYANYLYSCSYEPYTDSPFPCRSGRCVPYKMTPPKVDSSHFSQSIDYYHNQHQQRFKDYYQKFPYPSQPIHETTHSSDYYPDSYGSRLHLTGQRTESNNIVQNADTLHPAVGQIITEPYGNEILNIVNVKGEKNDISAEKVVLSENLGLGQGVHDNLGI